MRTSATGRSSSSPRAARGFTLIEILVVVLIIGIMAVGVTLSLGGPDDDDGQLNTERDRVLNLVGHLREQATLQNREFGMRCFTGGYEFLVLDRRRGVWESLEDDPLTRRRSLPEGLELHLVVEGRRIVLPKAEVDEPQPQVLLFSSGEVSSFELILEREASGAGAAAKGIRVQPDADDPAGALTWETLALP